MQSADRDHLQHEKTIISNTGQAIESLLQLEKENETLHSELSHCLERSQTELYASCQKFLTIQKELQKASSCTCCLQKSQDLATVCQQQAVTKAHETLKE